jgi:hypothetical protein
MGDTEVSGDIPIDVIRAVLKSQYHASLAMLREAIDRCPDHLWTNDEYLNSFWQVAYHTLYFTHLYLQPNEAAFRPWEGHQAEVQNPDGIAGPADSKSLLPLIPEPYSRADTLAYWQICEELVDDAVDTLDLTSPDSGFHWYRMSKLEHQLANIRHIQHHAAQLADRLRSSEGIGIRWVDGRSRGSEG